MFYRAYGLVIDSELRLPELLCHPETLEPSPADVVVRVKEVPSDGLPGGEQAGPFLWVLGMQLWLEVPGVARFWVRDGQSIDIQILDECDEDSVRVFLLGSALGALLLQRGFLVLHGNAIRVGDHCLICVGQSGAGKSTLAAGFVQRGYSLLADDVVPIDTQCRAWPGFPRLKLWQDTADHLGIDTSGLSRIRPEMAQFNYPVPDHFASEPLPVRWVYILNTHHESGIQLHDIRGMLRFQPLRNNTYRLRLLDGMALHAEHLKLCGQLARSIVLTRVSRPVRGFQLDALMNRILDHAAETL